ncbi:MAG TPA: ABC transporter permease [Vicinamibacterales bacterium]|jgi:putative ABC transport system permease protein
MKRSLRSWLWRVPLDEEVDEEIAFHIEMRTRELVERGMEPKAARDLVLSRLGDVRRLKRTCIDLGRKRDREMRLTQWISELRDDVKCAIRQLRTAPGFAAVATLTLALGIGVNGAIFALVDATLLRPLPLPAPDRLVMAWERNESVVRNRVAPGNMLDWNVRSRMFVRLAGFIPNVGGMVMAGADGNAETVPRQWVTGGIFDVLGITPVAGRTFRPSDEQQKTGAVVLSEGFWRSRFGADPGVIGRDISLDGSPYTVVGVLPEAAQLVGTTSIWALMPLNRLPPTARGPRILHVVGRLRPSVTLDAASVDMSAVAQVLSREFEANRGWSVHLEPLHDAFVGSELRWTSLFFLGVVGFVMLICCANVANLLLARATVREREIAIRSALGAGRRRIVRQLLTESLVLALIGGVCGVGIGALILRAAPWLVPEGLLPGAVTLSFDTRVFLFCAAAAVMVGLLFGVAPAWHARGSAPLSMTAESRATTTRGGGLRNVLVVGEIATAVLLLFGAGLLLRTLLALDHVDRGYRAESVLTMLVDPLGSRYPTPASLLQFFDDVEREVRAVPGVRNAAWASTLPMGTSQFGQASFEIVGNPPVDEQRRPSADYQIVGASYFDALDLSIVAGRPFTDRDRPESAPVCVVNEAFVRTHLQGRTAIGARVAMRVAADRPPVIREIVGVARQVKGRPDEREDFVQLYVPITQRALDDMYLLVRPLSGDAASLARSVRAAIGRVDKDQLVSVREVMTLENVAMDATARHRFRAVMGMSFAGLALLLAMVGVFGVLAYSVQQRVREIGVRIALGATSRNVLRLVVTGAVRMIALGAAVGLAGAALLARSMSTFLFGVQPLDPMTFAAVAIVLVLTASLAAAAPAWRAARIDPVEAFRSE